MARSGHPERAVTRSREIERSISRARASMLEGRRGVTFADRVAVRVTQALQGSASWNASTSGTRVGGGWSGDHHAAVPMPAETSALVMMRIQQRQRMWPFSVHARQPRVFGATAASLSIRLSNHLHHRWPHNSVSERWPSTATPETALTGHPKTTKSHQPFQVGARV